VFKLQGLMAHDPASKSVLVTGGARRIGAAIAKRFAERGWHVVVHYNRAAEKARNLAASLPSAEAVQCDLGDTDATQEMITQLAARLTDWRVLVNNASVFQEDSVTALDPATNRLAMQINATAPAVMAQTFLAHARSQAGRRVIQLTDQKLANPNPDFFSYSMSKHAADSAAKMLSMACKGDDRFYRLAPGAILASHDQSPEEAERSHKMNLLKRRTSAAEVADAALFLAEGPLANGQELFIDSGQHLLSQPRDVIYLARGETS
jgi:NAD(P)-dependent dehydrogenase (short-subunit alcohol dehydrogenase family)